VPSRQRSLTPSDAARHVAERAFTPPLDRPGSEPRIGIEAEWFPIPLSDSGLDPDSRPPQPAGRVRPAGSLLTIEPGGQLELSTPPIQGIGPACAALAADAAHLSTEVHADGFGLTAVGFDPGPPRARHVDKSRYAAMEAHFDARGPSGRAMMRHTAAVQVNLDLGPTDEVAEARWRRANDVGPLLAAAFSNSPLLDGAPSGGRSQRLVTWAGIDAQRSGPPAANRRGRDAWAEYSLAAPIMFVRSDDGHHEPVIEAMPFARWIDEGHELGHPTIDDLDYHLTTLFPPVRPKGWLELRMFDALPDPWWRVAVAVAVTLVCDEESAAVIAPTIAPVRNAWSDAARHGLHHPELARAACSGFAVALEALSRLGTDAATVAAVEAYYERYVSQGRTPADDRLAEWSATGQLFPAPDRFRELSWV
jgi:glutamate--cysteine ligase